MTDAFDRLREGAAEVELASNQQEIEETLLVGLVASPQAAARIVGETGPDDYHFDRHREFAGYAYKAAREGRHFDLVTLQAAVEQDKARGDDWDGWPKLRDFAVTVFTKAQEEPPTLGKVESRLDLFVPQARRRRALSMIDAARRGLEDGSKTPEVAAADVFRAIADLEASGRLTGAGRTETDDLDAWFAALEARQQGDQGRKFAGLDTGFDHLNNLLNGFMPEQMIVIGAPPGTGKTTFAKQLADNIVEENARAAVLFVTLEQSKEDLRIKSLSRRAGAENRKIRNGRLDPHDPSNLWRKVEQAKDQMAKHAGRMVIVEGDRFTTVDRVRLEAIQTRQRTQADHLVIFVDYLQIMPVDDPYLRDIRMRVDFNVTELRRIARDLRATVVAIASVNRKAYVETRGTMEAFKESGAIEFTADVGLVLVEDNDDQKADRKGEDHYQGTVEDAVPVKMPWKRIYCDVVKNRNGESGKRVNLRYFPKVDAFRQTEDQYYDIPSSPGRGDNA